MTLKRGAWIEPDKFIKQIADAGYEARKDEVKLTMTGKLEKEGETLRFTMDDVGAVPQKFIVRRGTSKREKEAQDFAAAYSKAQDLAGKTVEMEAYWQPADKRKDRNALPSLVVIRCEGRRAE